MEEKEFKLQITMYWFVLVLGSVTLWGVIWNVFDLNPFDVQFRFLVNILEKQGSSMNLFVFAAIVFIYAYLIFLKGFVVPSVRWFIAFTYLCIVCPIIIIFRPEFSSYLFVIVSSFVVLLGLALWGKLKQ